MPALFIGPAEREALRALREKAGAAPVDMPALMARIGIPEAKAAHMRQMTAQTIEIPVGFFVTFSIETGHPCGTARHMSLSRDGAGDLVPRPEIAWMVAEELGFGGSLETCVVWFEELRQGKAVNIAQPIAVAEAGRA